MFYKARILYELFALCIYFNLNNYAYIIYDIMCLYSGDFMESEKIQTFLKNIYKELNVSPDNEEYIRYLGEKVIKAYKYAKKSNISFDEFMVRIKSLIPKFIEEYNRMSVNFSNVKNIMNTNFGVILN